ncbi:MAG: hypothetical protein GKR84_04150 [Candidatus Nanopelagicales bacterium]|nr:hypothetical protein [Candidatus Nanopelagicales bacterium]OUV53617.1 MAG: hypothetical protein CBC75_01915 [Actinomycetales bacterium TMED115]
MVEGTLGEKATTIVLWLWFIGWAFELARIDIREHRLPNRMVAVCFAGCVIASLMHAIVVADFTALVTPAIASLAAATCFVIGHVSGGIGMGDVKFALVTGWMLGTIGWSAVWWGHVVAFVIAGVVVAGGWLLGGWRRDRPIAFGPFMGLGVIVAGAAALGSVG